MNYLEFFNIASNLKLRKTYYVYATVFGLTSLVVPLGAQFLVNNLALSGIWVNVLSFLIILSIGLLLSNALSYFLVILKEFIQRELFMLETSKWLKEAEGRKNSYFLESIMLLKTFSTVFTNFVEMGLVLIFGLITIILFHPVFLILPLFFVLTFFLIHRITKHAIGTSISESDAKYALFDLVLSNKNISEEGLEKYLVSRDNHFSFIKSISLKISLLNIISQVSLLGTGIYLIEVDKLSIGQLIAAEIILTGILQSISKLPSTLESLYDFETSVFKLKKALKGYAHA
jgi:ABC-type protease/lipase transport system fused ATPase/permease subunit